MIAGITMLGFVGGRVTGAADAGHLWLASSAEVKPRARILDLRWDSLLIANHVLRGNQESPTVIKLADYECRFCRTMHLTLSNWLANERSCGLIYVHTPLPGNQYSSSAAAAALCSERVGVFDALHAELMTSDDWRRNEGAAELLKRLAGVDQATVDECMSSQSIARRIALGVRVAVPLDLAATPTFLGKRGHLHLGVANEAELARLR